MQYQQFFYKSLKISTSGKANCFCCTSRQYNQSVLKFFEATPALNNSCIDDQDAWRWTEGAGHVTVYSNPCIYVTVEFSMVFRYRFSIISMINSFMGLPSAWQRTTSLAFRIRKEPHEIEVSMSKKPTHEKLEDRIHFTALGSHHTIEEYCNDCLPLVTKIERKATLSTLIPIIIITVIGGISITLQAQFMGLMDKQIGTLESVFITYGGGGLLIGLAMLLCRGGNLAAWQGVSWYALSSGALGLVIVGTIGYGTARLGLVAVLTQERNAFDIKESVGSRLSCLIFSCD